MSINKNLKRQVQLEQELNKRVSRDNLLRFTKYTFPKYFPGDFHKTYCKIVDQFAKGIIKRLIITVPPQHGKSEISTRRLPAFLFGHDPDLKIAVASYNTVFARKFNRDIQRIIDSDEYRDLFPNTQINGKNVVTVNSYLRNADEFEIIGHKGSLKAVGRGGALTGMPVDILIVDDLYKDYEEGNSPIILDSAWNWYTSVANTRLHNDSQQLIVFTRWNEEDLIGRLEQKEKVITLSSFLDEYDNDTWYKINYEAIMESEASELDDREVNDPLWKERHSYKKLDMSRSLDPEYFNSMYQGNPQPREGLLYHEFETYTHLPDLRYINAYTDVADTGKDYLCCIIYGIGLDDKVYLIDVLYTQEPMEITEVLTASLIDKYNVQRCYIESNSGGRGFARKVKELLIKPCAIDPFHQSGNKESRIFTNHAGVNSIRMPLNWQNNHKEFYLALKNFKKLFKANKHDDASDTLTGIWEKYKETNLNYLDSLAMW